MNARRQGYPPCQKCKRACEQAQVADQKQKDEGADQQRDVAIRMDGNDDPIEDSEIGDQSGQKTEGKGLEARFSVNGVKQGDKRNPGKKLQIEIWKRKDEEHPGEKAQQNVPLLHGRDLKKEKNIFQGRFNLLE